MLPRRKIDWLNVAVWMCLAACAAGVWALAYIGAMSLLGGRC